MGEPTQAELATATAKLADKIAQRLEERFISFHVWGAPDTDWDQEEARNIIREQIPATTAQADAELDQFIAVTEEADAHPGEPRPSSLALLRQALHADGLTLKCVLEAATHKVNSHTGLVEACEAAMRFLENDIGCEAVRLSIINDHLRPALSAAKPEKGNDSDDT
jgi:hypothetical protein